MTFNIRSDRAMRGLDANGDGELGQGEVGDAVIARFDLDGNRKLSTDELTAALGGINDPNIQPSDHIETTPFQLAASRAVRARERLADVEDIDWPVRAQSSYESEYENARASWWKWPGGIGGAATLALGFINPVAAGILFCLTCLAMAVSVWVLPEIFVARPDPERDRREAKTEYRAALEALAAITPKPAAKRPVDGLRPPDSLGPRT